MAGDPDLVGLMDLGLFHRCLIGTFFFLVVFNFVKLQTTLPRRLLPGSVNVFKFNGSDKSSPYEVMLTADVNVSISLAQV